MHQGISACRFCENTQLVEILDLGVQALSSVFPRERTERVAAGPLKLLKCTGGPAACGVLQLAYDQSGNELRCRPSHRLFGVCDAVSVRAGEHVRRLLDRLTAGLPPVAAVRSKHDCRNAIIVPFAALSSREQPIPLLQQIRESLDDRSVCVLEERYMPSMLRRNAYDSICHEHLTYCGLKQIKWMTDRVGLKIVDLEFDHCGAGTISIAVAKSQSSYEQSHTVETTLDEEARAGLHTLDPYRAFGRRVTAGIALLRTLLDQARNAGKSVSALGASQEGNVILQCCHATQGDIGQVGETDSVKVGAFTPGTLLPIVAEEDVLASEPNFLLVLPWKLREVFLSQRKFCGCNLLFPLPKLELVQPASLQ